MTVRELAQVLETITFAEVIVSYASVADWPLGHRKAAELGCRDLLDRLIVSVPIPLDMVDSLIDKDAVEPWREVEDSEPPCSAGVADIDKVIAYLRQYGTA